MFSEKTKSMNPKYSLRYFLSLRFSAVRPLSGRPLSRHSRSRPSARGRGVVWRQEWRTDPDLAQTRLCTGQEPRPQSSQENMLDNKAPKKVEEPVTPQKPASPQLTKVRMMLHWLFLIFHALLALKHIFYSASQKTEVKLEELLREVKSLRDQVTLQDRRIAKLEEQVAKVAI